MIIKEYIPSASDHAVFRPVWSSWFKMTFAAVSRGWRKRNNTYLAGYTGGRHFYPNLNQAKRACSTRRGWFSIISFKNKHCSIIPRHHKLTSKVFSNLTSMAMKLYITTANPLSQTVEESPGRDVTVDTAWEEDMDSEEVQVEKYLGWWVLLLVVETWTV